LLPVKASRFRAGRSQVRILPSRQLQACLFIQNGQAFLFLKFLRYHSDVQPAPSQGIGNAGTCKAVRFYYGIIA